MEKKEHISFPAVREGAKIVTTDGRTVNNSTCSRMVQEIASHINIHAGQLYEELMQLLDNHIAAEDVELTDHLYDLSVLRRAVREEILNRLEHSVYGSGRAELIQELPCILQQDTSINSLLADLMHTGEIHLTEEGIYTRAYMTAVEYANSLEKVQHRMILSGGLSGKTLEEIGQECNLTRERVRQIEQKCIRHAPTLAEDKYAAIFEKYDISRDDFLLGFQENQSTFNYLSSAYKRGTLPLSELLIDPDIPIEFKRAAERIQYKNHVTLGGERVLCTRSELSEYVLRSAGGMG